VLGDWLRPGARVLDVGSGTGYLTALFAEFVTSEPGGVVVGIDHIPASVRVRARGCARMCPLFIGFRV
jgi:protein-L-isoaspartate(D-aspartate) O-methyltransferase